MLPDCLPRLSGAALIAYRISWLALLPVAIVAALADQLAAWSPTRMLETVALLGASAVLFRRRGVDAIAAMIALAFLLWVVTASTAWAGMDAAVLLAVLDRVRFLLFVTAMMLFPTGRFDPAWTRFGVGAIAAAFLVGIAEAARLIPSGLHVPPTMACAALAVAAMRSRLNSLPPGVQRQQIKWVALGLALGLTLVAISRLGSLAAPRDSIVVQALLTGAFDLGVTVIALGVLISLLRYRLYDADAAISRSSAIALLTVTLIGVFAAAEVVIQAISQSLFGDGAGTVSSAIAAAVAAAMIAPLHGWVAGWTERRFQPALAAFRREMPELLMDLRDGSDLAALGDALLVRIERATRASHATLLVGHAPVAMRHADIAHDDAPQELPLELDGAGCVGRLLLGPRPDGSRLGKDEREAVEEIARPLARAIRAVEKNAAAERRQQRQAKQIAELGRRLEMLERPAGPQAEATVSTI
jgi:hypothetical protein